MACQEGTYVQVLRYVSCYEDKTPSKGKLKDGRASVGTYSHLPIIVGIHTTQEARLSSRASEILVAQAVSPSTRLDYMLAQDAE